MYIIKTLAQALAASLRPSPKTFLIALLSLFLLAGFDARADSLGHALREKDALRAERIITKLRGMEQALMETSAFGKRQQPLEKISSSLFVEVAELRASHLKTDLTTAIFLYEEASNGQFNANDAAPDCEDELREAYSKLCRENQTGTLAGFLMAKARLHTLWAEATLKDYRGSKDAITMATLEEMLTERRRDVKLAESAVAALKSLEKEIYNYSSLAEFEEHRRLARVSFARLSADASASLQHVNRVLLSLPRSTLFYPLYHARNAYANGLFWWQKTDRQSKLVVNVNAFKEPDEMKSSNFDKNSVSYTVVINWRKAVKHTREAENMIEALKIG